VTGVGGESFLGKTLSIDDLGELEERPMNLEQQGLAAHRLHQRAADVIPGTAPQRGVVQVAHEVVFG
jgi:hypothetical protein